MCTSRRDISTSCIIHDHCIGVKLRGKSRREADGLRTCSSRDRLADRLPSFLCRDDVLKRRHISFSFANPVCPYASHYCCECIPFRVLCSPRVGRVRFPAAGRMSRGSVGRSAILRFPHARSHEHSMTPADRPTLRCTPSPDLFLILQRAPDELSASAPAHRSIQPYARPRAARTLGLPVQDRKGRCLPRCIKWPRRALARARTSSMTGTLPCHSRGTSGMPACCR